ncbi:hypothetical protein RSAG8_13191, partial [Rhizoctonia solani AG-8 WAC10335]
MGGWFKPKRPTSYRFRWQPIRLAKCKSLYAVSFANFPQPERAEVSIVLSSFGGMDLALLLGIEDNIYRLGNILTLSVNEHADWGIGTLARKGGGPYVLGALS